MYNNCDIKTLLYHLEASPYAYEYKELKKWADRFDSKHSVTRHFANAIWLEYCHPKVLPAFNLTTISKDEWVALIESIHAFLKKRKT